MQDAARPAEPEESNVAPPESIFNRATRLPAAGGHPDSQARGHGEFRIKGQAGDQGDAGWCWRCMARTSKG